MLTVKNNLGAVVNVNDELTVTGDPQLAEVVDIIAKGLDLESIHAKPLGFLYYELEKIGFDVAADVEDLGEIELPKGAIM